MSNKQSVKQTNTRSYRHTVEARRLTGRVCERAHEAEHSRRCCNTGHNSKNAGRTRNSQTSLKSHSNMQQFQQYTVSYGTTTKMNNEQQQDGQHSNHTNMQQMCNRMIEKSVGQMLIQPAISCAIAIQSQLHSNHNEHERKNAKTPNFGR